MSVEDRKYLISRVELLSILQPLFDRAGLKATEVAEVRVLPYRIEIEHFIFDEKGKRMLDRSEYRPARSVKKVHIV